MKQVSAAAALLASMVLCSSCRVEAPIPDQVQGTLHVEPPCDPGPGCIAKPRYTFDVVAGREGEAPQGSVAFETGERSGVVSDRGPVTCLSVDDDRATIGVSFQGASPSFPPAPPHAALVFVEDGGPAGSDRFAVQELPGAQGPSTCPATPPQGVDFSPGYPGGLGESSGVTVLDGPTLPTSEERCRASGWANYFFESRRECVAFVKRTNAVTELPVPGSGTGQPLAITAGPDGAMWFTVGGGRSAIGRLTTTGAFTDFPTPTQGSIATGITPGPDGALWFTLRDKIGRITTAGQFTEFTNPAGGGSESIAAGSDGALWFTRPSVVQGSIGRVTTAGGFSNFTVGDGPWDITGGPDGALWFTDLSGAGIGRITTSGSFTDFPLDPASTPVGIAVGPDGALWFTDSGANKIGRITTSGAITEFPIPTRGSGPGRIATGPDGALWFTESSANKVACVTTGGVFREFPIPTRYSAPFDVAAGPDGAMYITTRSKILRIAAGPRRRDRCESRWYGAP